MSESASAPHAAALVAWLRERSHEIAALTETLARIESPSTDPSAQRAVHAQLARRLEPLGYRARRHRLGDGEHLLLRPRRRGRDGGFSLLVGHSDTVWPHGTLARMPVRTAGAWLHGPGVFDMKAGLALGVFALEALAALGLVPPLAPVWFVAGDEERGSPGSRRLLVPLARAASRALVLEPALGPEGRLKLVRKGVGRFEITATGHAAHAGLDPAAGANAISELARQIVHLERWAQGVPGLQLNVGRIEGGEAPNVVAAHARAVLDVRAPEPDVAARCQAKLAGLRPHDPRVQLTVRGGFSRPPMPRTARNVALAERAQALAHTLGFALHCGEAGGGSDANLTSPCTPTLDGLGPVGAGAHAANERVHLPSLPERAALLALLLLEPAHAAGP